MNPPSTLNAPLLRRLACLNLIIIVVLCLDGFVHPQMFVATFDHGYERHPARSAAHYYVVSKEGETFKLPVNTDMALREGDTFYVKKTWLFHRERGLLYPGPAGKLEAVSLNFLRGTPIWAVICVITGIISLLNLGKWVVFRDVGLNDRLILGASVTMICLAVAYFV